MNTCKRLVCDNPRPGRTGRRGRPAEYCSTECGDLERSEIDAEAKRSARYAPFTGTDLARLAEHFGYDDGYRVAIDDRGIPEGDVTNAVPGWVTLGSETEIVRWTPAERAAFHERSNSFGCKPSSPFDFDAQPENAFPERLAKRIAFERREAAKAAAKRAAKAA